MSLKSGSTLKEVPNVNSAVEHLQELGERMCKDEFGFSEEDVGTVDLIIEAVRELENECGKLHDKLETETISASILRHKLLLFPGQIRNEVKNAVNAARQSNADELDDLQTNLKNINDNIKSLEEKHGVLEQDNSVLHPERDRVRKEHEEIIARLNQRMAEKASKQIVLNETRDKLRETNQKIMELEDGLIQLKEDLIQERADARMEKKRLKKAVYDTTMKTREQKETNITKKRELDELHEKVMESEEQVDKICRNIRRFETSRSRLEGQERALSAQLSRELKHNDELRVKGTDLNEKLVVQKDTFNQKRTVLEEKIRELDGKIKDETEKNQELGIQREKMDSELEQKMTVMRFDESRVKEQNDALQRSKQELAWKAEDVARLRAENISMEERIDELGETHESIINTLQKQIEDLRETLSKERKERMELQEQRDSVQNEIDIFKNETNKYMNEVNRQINEGKEQHDSLTKEGNSLQKSLREDEAMILKLRELAANKQKEYKQQAEQQHQEVLNMENEIERMEKDTKDKKQAIEDQTPGFLELEAHFEEKTTQYESSKKELVTLKNKKLSLEDSVKRSKRELDRMINPRAQFEQDLKKKRAENLRLMRSHAERLRHVEGEIYTVGCKLKTTLEENDRFIKANREYETDIEDIECRREENDEVIRRLEAQLDEMKAELSNEWLEDKKLEKVFAERDQVVVDELELLLTKTGSREEVIGGITEKLKAELTVLSEFLENVARRRPPELKSSGKSRSSKPQSAKPEIRLRTDSLSARAVTPITAVMTSNAEPEHMKLLSPRPPDTSRSKKNLLAQHKQ